MRGFIKKIRHGYIWERIFVERITEPLHLNIISLFVWAFGSSRLKMKFDLLLRHNHAYGLFAAADLARQQGLKRISVIEFGVANGAGLINLQTLAARVTRDTGVDFQIFGFDTGEGMPPPKSYKDHPELYQGGDFPMADRKALLESLSPNTKIIFGNLDETVPEFCKAGCEDAPIGFVSVDVDYYSSTVDALELFRMKPESYLPQVVVYVDDLEFMSHNSWCGEMAAIHEFNEQEEFRKIEKHAFLRGFRIFKNARWIDHMYQAHILDHPIRNALTTGRKPVVLTNPHIKNNASSTQ